MTVILTVSEIGRAGHADATDRAEYADIESARNKLVARFGHDSIRGGITGGTVGSMNGRVFQASRTWVIHHECVEGGAR